MRLGLFGGSFDPVHRGHVGPVAEARRALHLDRVLYLPTAQPPHKPKRELAPAHARYAMVEMALLHEEGLYVSAHELTLGRPAYTVETLAHFRRELPDAELFLLLGSDSFADLDHWHRWREIPELAELALLARPGWDADRLRSELPPELAELLASGRVHRVDNDPVGVSSTVLRQLLAAGEALPAGAIPPLVVDYLQKYSYYR